MIGLVPFNRRNKNFMDLGFNEISNVFDNFLKNNFLGQNNNFGDIFKIDVQENENEYIIEAEIPGVKKDNVNIMFDKDVLNLSIKKEENLKDKNNKYIHKERSYSQMSRSVVLVDANEEKIKANLNEGILTITIPKLEKINTSKQIMIE